MNDTQIKLAKTRYVSLMKGVTGKDLFLDLTVDTAELLEQHKENADDIVFWVQLREVYRKAWIADRRKSAEDLWSVMQFIDGYTDGLRKRLKN